ncbi:MAG TPA: lantibiotic dehydratase family protein, partial [Kribbellaceae bacterium]|nr:lantibiotic dehydratase family protein [Kribbellaceae bacterium]
MGTGDTGPLYRHAGVALLRSAVRASTQAPGWWPDPNDPQACCSWLRQVWSEPDFADAVRQASPGLARRVEAICGGQAWQPRQIRRATMATAGYLLRALGRPTPFGLFAGVAPVIVGGTAGVRWGCAHRPVVRVDTQWLADVIDRLQAHPDLLERVDVAFTNLAVRRGGRLESPSGLGRVHVRYSAAVRARNAAAAPVRFGALVDTLAANFAADRSRVAGMLTELVRQGFLVTCLRAPLTVTDPLTHLLDRLAEVGAGTLPSTVSLLHDLATVRAELQQLNHGTTRAGRAGVTRAAITRRMRQISPAGRTPLAVDLRLDCHVQLPEHVAQEMARAATTLLHLTRHPAGWPAWRDYHAAFCDRYGTATLVPVTQVVDPDAGLGYPAGYPGSILPAPVDGPSPRDERLLALAWQTVTDGSREIVLTDQSIRAVAGDQRLDPRWIPPHVELAARIHAADAEALARGAYTLTVAPARAGGTLTSRFTPTTTGCGLQEVYRGLPVAVHGALAVQMSFPPAYPHAENVCRIPAYLPHLLSLGASQKQASIALDDLAVTATGERLHLVSISRRQVIEPQVFHALALDKQPPPLARFLAHLPRAYCATWTVLDWGPYAERLPYLPRVRYRRSILAPARWRLTTDELPRAEPDLVAWRRALDLWLRRLACPSTVEMRDERPYAAAGPGRAGPCRDPAHPAGPARPRHPHRSRPAGPGRMVRRTCPRDRGPAGPCRCRRTLPPCRVAAGGDQRQPRAVARRAGCPVAVRTGAHPSRAARRDHRGAAPG